MSTKILKVQLHLFLIFFLFSTQGFCFAQSNTTQQSRVVEVIKKSCMKCHNNDDFGNLNFSNFQNILSNSAMIKYVVAKRIMPPWRADTSYHCFLNDRRLSEEDITLIQQWIPTSEKKNEKLKTDFSKNNFDALSKPDLIVSMPKAFHVPATGKDVFLTYVLKTNIKEDKYISAIVIKPSNSKELHHARVEIDSTDYYDKKVNEEGYVITSEIEQDASLGLLNSKPLAIYLPGLFYNKFPKGTAYPLRVNDKIILHLHYAPTNFLQEDKTEVWIYYSDEPQAAKVIFKNGSMNDFSITIPPDSLKQISFTTAPINYDFSIFALQLHMHLLGKSISLKAITPSEDTINLLNIPNWDFNWQEFYYYKSILTIPKGSVFVASSEFDNTADNPKNPNIPPQTVNFYGMDTRNEMMGFICLGFNASKDSLLKKIDLSDY